MIARRRVDVVVAMAVVMELVATVEVVTAVVEIATGKPHQRG